MLGANILWTFLSKSGSALFSLAILIISSRNLGPENMGIISLIILSITIIQLATGLLGGSAIVYMTPRAHLLSLLIPSYFFSVIGSLTVTTILNLLDAIPTGYVLQVFILGSLVSCYTVNLYLLLGKEKIKWHNFLTLGQSVMMLGSIGWIYFFQNQRNVQAYVLAYGASYGLVFILSLFMIPYSASTFKWSSVPKALSKTLVYGFLVQLSSLLQLGNYRFTYYIIKAELGLAALGIFSVSMQVAESVWIISRSISMVQFARVSNSDDNSQDARRTSFLVKLSLAASFAAILVFFAVPSSLFAKLFGGDFIAVKKIILFLSPGILFVAITSILSAYFSGSGKIYINTIGSFIGLVVVIITSLFLVQNMGLKGAAISNSVAYASACIFAVIIFISVSKIPFGQLLPNPNDTQLLRQFLGRFFGNRK